MDLEPQTIFIKSANFCILKDLEYKEQKKYVDIQKQINTLVEQMKPYYEFLEERKKEYRNYLRKIRKDNKRLLKRVSDDIEFAFNPKYFTSNQNIIFDELPKK
jgi:type III secretory pathway component EscR